MIDPEMDARFMAAAIALGRRGLGLCAPNPAVGALIVKDGVIVARGWTKPGGRPHAETEALRAAAERAQGATIYVTLEPCSHHGATPPCAEAIIAAKIARVVYAACDPDPRVAGSGHKRLAEAGVAVTEGVLAEEACRANLGHMLRVSQQRPMVTLKLALTADGYAAGGRDEPRLVITGAHANGLVHVMRSMHDAIMVGGGTIAADDPMLNVRLPGLDARKPLRVALDSELRLSPSSRFAAAAKTHPTLVITGAGASEAAASRLRAAKIEVAHAPRDQIGRVDLVAALELLGRRGITRVFSEGGPRVASSLISRGLADEVMLFTGARSLGRAGLAGLDLRAAAALCDPSLFVKAESRAVGEDRLTRYERIV